MAQVHTLDSFPRGSFSDVWEQLTTVDPQASVFHTPAFLRVWWSQLGGSTAVRVRLVLEGQRLVGVVPEVRQRVGSVTGPRVVAGFAGGTEVTDYRGPISAAADRRAVASAWIEELAGDREWDDLVAGGLAEDAGWHDAIATAGRAAGFTVVDEVAEDVCPRIDLSGGWAGYLERVGAKQRHEIRRKTRRLAAGARSKVRLVRVAPERLGDGLRRFYELTQGSGSEKSRFFDDRKMRAFFGALADELGADGPLRLHNLELDGAVAASAVSFVRAGEWGLYNMAFDESWADLAPGMVLVAELIRSAAEEETIHTFDLLRGDEPYKYRFGAVDRPLRRVTMTRATS